MRHGRDSGRITDEGVARLRARIGDPRAAPDAAALPAPDARHVPQRRRSPTATTTRCGAIPTYGAKTRWGGPIAPPRARRRRHADRRGRGHRGRARAPRPDEGRPAARRARVLRRRARASGGRRCDPMRRCSAATRSSARSTSRASSPSGPIHEWTAQVFRDDDGHAAVGPVPADDPHRAREGARAQEVRRHRARAVHRRRRSPRSTRSTTRERAARRRAALVGGRRGGRRGRPDGEGPADRHRHGLLARRHGHGPLRREAAAARLRRTASASRGSSTATSSNVPDVMQRVHWDPEFARRVGQPDHLRLRPHARDVAHPPLHRLDGRRRLAVEARLRVPPVQLRRRHAMAARARRAQVPRRRRPARGRPRARGREPARRGHHARARDDPAAEPRARRRSGCPIRPAARRDLQGALDAISAEFARR